MTDINSMKCDLQQLYIRYDELTSSEEDKELRDYNEQLLESITEAQQYINTLEELLKNHMRVMETIQNTSIRADCTLCKHENEDICRDCGQDHILSEYEADIDKIVRDTI